MGRNWLEKIRLNWNSIHKVNSDHLQTVLTQYAEVFKPELGTMKQKYLWTHWCHHDFVKQDQSRML